MNASNQKVAKSGSNEIMFHQPTTKVIEAMEEKASYYPYEISVLTKEILKCINHRIAASVSFESIVKGDWKLTFGILKVDLRKLHIG